MSLPGSFEAEDFDRGGEGVAYHDNVPGNAGGQYRTSEDVDIVVSSDRASTSRSMAQLSLRASPCLNSIRVSASATPTTTRSEEGAASYTGTWTSYGPQTGTFSGGSMVASNAAGASATFSFTGTAVSWIGVKCALCGIATVSIDGGAPNTVNTAGPAASNVTSEPVLSASGLAPGVTHTMVIAVTGTTTSGGAHIAVDAFDVTR